MCGRRTVTRLMVVAGVIALLSPLVGLGGIPSPAMASGRGGVVVAEQAEPGAARGSSEPTGCYEIWNVNCDGWLIEVTNTSSEVVTYKPGIIGNIAEFPAEIYPGETGLVLGHYSFLGGPADVDFYYNNAHAYVKSQSSGFVEAHCENTAVTHIYSQCHFTYAEAKSPLRLSITP
jgi:hypothetical protein